MKFIKNKTYYSDTVYEWNLPAGTTCPFAKECKVSSDRITGKFTTHSGSFKCYAVKSERFPAVREHRWNNFDFVKRGGIPELPSDCRRVRIHASGDFFSQEYFDMWLNLCRESPAVEFWAYTKSLPFWVKRIDDIPANLTLTASYGGKYDDLIDAYQLKSAKVYRSISIVPPGMRVDTNDDLARIKRESFALLDNNAKK